MFEQAERTCVINHLHSHTPRYYARKSSNAWSSSDVVSNERTMTTKRQLGPGVLVRRLWRSFGYVKPGGLLGHKKCDYTCTAASLFDDDDQGGGEISECRRNIFATLKKATQPGLLDWPIMFQ